MRIGYLKILMQKINVREVSENYGVGLSGISIKIQRSEILLALLIMCSTDYKHIGRIDLFLNAFTNEE